MAFENDDIGQDMLDVGCDDTSRLLPLSWRQSKKEEKWGRKIMVRSDYQAKIPECLRNYDDALP
jgi:hypothetical protein